MLKESLSSLLAPHILFEAPAHIPNSGSGNEPDRIPRVFCDMDGVVADFHGAMKRFYGLHSSGAVEQFLQKPGAWDKVENDHPNIFGELPVLPEAQRLMRHLTKLRDLGHIKLAMLTALPTVWYRNSVMRDKGRNDKQLWIAKHFAGMSERNVIVCLRKDKVSFAVKQQTMGTPAPVLIDDYEVNIREWKKAKGVGILHTGVQETIQQLDQYLIAIGIGD